MAEYRSKYTGAEVDALLDKVNSGEASPMVSVTYDELKNLRDNGELVAGMQYRITDYVTTTVQENTRSAGHQFDVIVTADNENTLNEVARACKNEFDIEKYKDANCSTSGVKMLYVGLFSHDGKNYHLYEADDHTVQMLVDFNAETSVTLITSEYPYSIYPSYTRWNNEGQWNEWYYGIDEGEDITFKHNPTIASYFKDSNLAAWQIWYSLDNDVERFAWARTSLYSPITNQKMIIVNEGGQTYIYVRDSLYDSDGKCAWLYDIDTENNTSFIDYIKKNNESLDSNDIVYTDSEELKVGTELDMAGTPVMLVDMSWTEGKGVIYRMIDEWNNDCPYDFKNIKFDRGVYDGGGIAPDGDEDLHLFLYTFSFRTNELTEVLDTSIFGNNGRLLNDEGQISGVYGNVIGQYMAYDGSIESPTKTTQRLNDIVFYSYYEYENDTYYGCYNNSFGNNCYSNSFGNSCCDNIFSNSCYNNSFGNECCDNIFGNGCTFNSLGNTCYNNSFGDVCSNNSFKDWIGIADNFAYNKLDNEVYGVTFYVDDDKGAYGMLRNHHICSGVNNVTINLYADNIGVRTYTLDSNGVVKDFILGDLASLIQN